jgi:MFS-type transporter involved in bile tolerance (Atg22 family)
MDSQPTLAHKIIAFLLSPIAILGWLLASFLERVFGIDFDIALPFCWLAILIFILVMLIKYGFPTREICEDPDDNP